MSLFLSSHSTKINKNKIIIVALLPEPDINADNSYNGFSKNDFENIMFKYENAICKVSLLKKTHAIITKKNVEDI